MWEEEIITRFEQKWDHLCSIKLIDAVCDGHDWVMWSIFLADANDQKWKLNAVQNWGTPGCS